MRDYSPKRRTAVVLAGTASAGAYHAGVLRALDESGVKIDVLVGSGAGVVAAAFGAVAGGPKLYGRDGFWQGAGWASFYRLRPAVRVGLVLAGIAVAIFMLPLALALLAGLATPFALLAEALFPGWAAGIGDSLRALPRLLGLPYLAALAAPGFVLALVAVVALARLLLRDRRRLGEAFEALLDTTPAEKRLARLLWGVSRGAAISGEPASEGELGQRYVGLVSENLGQPGFRELVLRVADVEAGAALAFALLEEPHRRAFLRPRDGRAAGAVDLRARGYDTLFFDAVMTGLLPPGVTPPRRVAFPRGGLFGGETRRLTDATLVGGAGVSEAVAAGAEQVILVTAAPEAPAPPPRRRGPKALAGGLLAGLERQAIERERSATERLNRVVETLGHALDTGERGWEDPANGRLYRNLGLWLIRPERRGLGPLDLDGAVDPATEVLETIEDVMEHGYRDAYRCFVEPVVGAVPGVGEGSVEEIEGEPDAQPRRAVEL